MSKKELIVPDLQLRDYHSKQLTRALCLAADCKGVMCSDCAFDSDRRLLEYLKERSKQHE